MPLQERLRSPLSSGVDLLEIRKMLEGCAALLTAAMDNSRQSQGRCASELVERWNQDRDRWSAGADLSGAGASASCLPMSCSDRGKFVYVNISINNRTIHNVSKKFLY